MSTRTVILESATSLDGFIARADGAIDWLFSPEDHDFGDFMADIDTVLLGRKTFAQLLTFDVPWPYAGKQCVVYSRARPTPDLAAVVAEHGVIWVTSDPAEHVRALRQEPGKNKIWLVGGGALNHALIAAGLVDELSVSVHPVLLGAGIGLLGNLPLPRDAHFRYVDNTVYASGLVQLRYRRDGHHADGAS